MANIENHNSNSLLSGTNDGDFIINYGNGVTIAGGEGWDNINNNGGKNVSIDAGKGNDYIALYETTSWNESAGEYETLNSENVTVNGGEGSDSISNSGPNSSLNGGAGNDEIYNWDGGKDVTIEGGAGRDTIYNSGANVLFKYANGDGNDLIQGFNETSTLSIGGGTDSYSASLSGDDMIITVGEGTITLQGAANLSTVNIAGKEVGSWKLITLTEGADTYNNTLDGATIQALGGDDSIQNWSRSAVSVNGGAGNDTVYSWGSSKLTVSGGAGNDLINNDYSYGNNVFKYADGDGDDTITYFASTDTLQIGDGNGTYSASLSGNDMIITVGKGKIHLLGTAQSETLNIAGKEVGSWKFITLTENADTYDNTVEGATINALGGDDSIQNWSVGDVSINGGNGDDYIENRRPNVTVEGGAGSDNIANRNCSNVTISGGAGNDIIQNEGEDNSAVSIDAGEGDDYISNNGSEATINAGAGDDIIANSGENMSMNGGDGSDTVNNFGNSSTLIGGAGDDSIWNGGDNSLLDGGDGNDMFVNNGGENLTMLGGAGNDSIVNSNNKITIDGGTGNDEIDNYGGANVLFKYSSGDGNDIITGFRADSTLSIGNGTGTYSANLSGSDIIVTVGSGKITLSGAASLKSVNIKGTDKSTPAWTLKGTTATYGVWNKASVTVSGVKSLGGISLKDKVVTVSEAALNQSGVTISGDGYKLALDDKVTKPSTTPAKWTLGNGGATYTSGKISAGYTLADNKISYTKASGGETLVTVNGVKSLGGISLSGKVVTVSAASLNQKTVTVSDGYTLKLGSDVTKTSTKKSWSFKNSTATYKQTTAAGYTLADNSITYSKAASKTLATVKGVKSTSGLKISGTTITVSAASLNQKAVTVSNGYTLKLGSDVTKSKTTAEGWTFSGTTATYKNASTTKGYKLSNNKISYVKAGGGDVLSTIKGVKSKSGVSLNDEVVTLKKSALNNKVTLGGSFEFNLAAGNYKKTTITGSNNADIITSNGNNLSIGAGAGNDTIDIHGSGTTVTGGKGKDFFIYSSGGGKITDFGSTDTLIIGDGKGTYSAKASGKNLIITVDDGKITLNGAASLSSPNIRGTLTSIDIEFNDKQTAASLTATYNEDNFKFGAGLLTLNASAVTHNLNITGNKEANKVTGTSQDDYIKGDKGADTLAGGKGNDSLEGGAGNDSLIGGDGSDIFIYGNGDGNDIIADYAEEDSIKISKGTVKRISPTNDDVVFTVGSGKITVKDGRNKVISYIDAKGAEHFYPVDFDSKGKKATLLEVYAKDNFNVTDYADYKNSVITIDAAAVVQEVAITGNQNNNIIKGGKSNDTIYGGKGNDTLDGGAGADVFVWTGGDGNDTIINYSTEDKIKINANASAIKPKNKGNNVVLAVGNSSITVKDAKDKIVTYVDKAGNEIGYSNTVVLSNKGKLATLTDKYSASTFTAADYDSPIQTIDASAVQIDIGITGNGKANTIIGGAGDDTLTGGKGADLFVYNKSGGNDVISDYAEVDKISIASGAVSDAVTVKGNDVIFGISGNTLTVTKGKGKKITLIDKDGNQTGKYYKKSTVQTESLWFTQDDTNFATADNQLSAIVKNSSSAYSFAADSALSSTSSLPSVTYSAEK